ncbi:MAG: uracil-DNA glycosylase [Candidatus Moranbacteria bacterium]|nr:uracil-DNA glycosylase [Candidatus Moranbacteria bacterium]
MEFDQFIKEVNQCKKCRLSQTRNNVVPGEGNQKAEIMFIGEGPGKNEDEQGKPFVGAAGKFLDEMLQLIGFRREDIYIANVVKCRPPGNRDPLPDETEACWPWLELQLKLIKPKVIVLLGRHSATRFIPNIHISGEHGQPFRKNIPSLGKIILYPCYHPAAALYNGGLRQTLVKDFKKIPKILEIARQTQLEEEIKKENPKQQEPNFPKQSKLF